jgi:hypothetical protein
VIRNPFLTRARDISKVTIPSLLPPDGSQGQILYQPFQSIGSRGVNNLAAKLLLALLPPGDPFFKMVVDDFTLNELAAESGSESDDLRGEFEKALNAVERAAMDGIEIMGLRTTLSETLKNLIIAGNALLQVRDDETARLWRLNEYVVKRDPSGTVLECITKQMLSLSALPEEVKPIIDHTPKKSKDPVDDTIPMFTWIRRIGSMWEVRQEVQDKIVPGSDGTFPLDQLPYLPLRWTRLDNEDYGRGHGEEYMGDLYTAEALTQSLTEWAGAAAKILWLVNPNGITETRTLSKAPSGAFVDGDARDITTLQLEKFADFKVASDRLDKLERRLSAVFMLTSELPRDAERVTAEEIRLLAAELEDTLGGTFSLFSQELQLPLVKLVLNEMTRKGKIPTLPKDDIKPKIVTGLEALGRNADLRKLDTLMAGVKEIVPPEEAAIVIDYGAYIMRRAVALGIDMDGVVRSPEQQAALRQQQAQAQMTEKLGPEVISGVNQRALQSQQGEQ